jgi:hypothetical protein
MKNFKYLLFILPVILITPLLFIGCKEEKPLLSTYNLELEYDNNSHILSGREEVEYFNVSDNYLENINFHLYPNAFRQGAKNKIVSVSNVDKAYPNGESFGDIKIDSVEEKIDKDVNALEFSVAGEDENILSVKLKNGIYPDECVKIVITFKVTLANINHRLGYGENVVNFGNFYPVACVYEKGKGFMEELYHSNGDPFYSDVANYNVKISYPNSMLLACSGNVANESESGGMKTAQISQNKVRDFAFCLSENFNMIEKDVDGVKVKYYGYEGDQNLTECLEVSEKALRFFEETIGEYSYPTLSVVKTGFVHGGMEYPTLVMISDDCQSQEDFNYVIVHEIAHQWWYGMVGNDEYNNAWMDESLAEYSTLMFFEKHGEYNFDIDELVKNATTNFKFFVEVYTNVLGEVDTSMNRPLKDFQTEPEYVHCIYTKGSIMFHTLRQSVGDKRFEKALKTYFSTYCFKNATPAELIQTFIRSTGYNLEGFFNSWLDGSVIVM